MLDAERRPVAVVPAVRLDSHRLIEEFMILANVAAAEELEARHQPCMYRVHDAPDPEKLAALRDFLDELGIPGLAFAKGQAPKPELFNRLLRRAAASPEAALVNELVLRCQAQAVYSPNNIGHFGLGLRALRAFHLADPALCRSPRPSRADRRSQRGGRRIRRRRLPADIDQRGWRRSASISRRPSAAPPRPSAPRSTATARPWSPTRSARSSPPASAASPNSGCSSPCAESGATGLVPISTLPGDYYDRHEKVPRLVGRRYGRVFRLGDAATVRLVEADAIGGRLLFRIEDERTRGAPQPCGRPRPRRG